MTRTIVGCFGFALALGLANGAGCSSATDLGELGVYNRKPPPHEAGAGQMPSEDPNQVAATSADAGGVPPTLGAEQGLSCRVKGCISTDPILYADRSVTCVPVVAHEGVSNETPYSVPVTPDHYVTFTTRIGGSQGQYIRAFSAIIGAAVALHDMRLYAHNGVIREGTTVGRATESGLQLLYSWSPGVNHLYLDESVAIPTEDNTFYTLEVHYNYVGQPGAPARTLTDNSGFFVCVTPTAPKYPVSFTRLGTEDIDGTAATGTCTSTARGPIELLAVRPRMNALGRNAKLFVRHGHGDDELVYEAPYDYNTDGIVALGSLTISPDDRLTSRCDYAERARFGTGVTDEVCELYVLHWPAHGLVSGRRPGIPDVCMD